MKSGLYSLFLERLTEIKTEGETIPYGRIYEKICRNFSITKKECLELIFLFRDLGFIEFIGNKGIKLRKNKIKEFIGKQKKTKLHFRDIPKTCINECEECNKEFEAKITIASTCNHCLDEMIKRIEEKTKNCDKSDWPSKLLALVEESKKKK